MNLLNFLCMRKGVETPGNILESPCLGAYTLVEKEFLIMLRGTYTEKTFLID